MKLYVCGTRSGNPEEWTAWTELSLILAEDEAQAEELAGEPVFEVDMSKPRILVSMPEPNWGDDL